MFVLLKYNSMEEQDFKQMIKKSGSCTLFISFVCPPIKTFVAIATHVLKYNITCKKQDSGAGNCFFVITDRELRIYTVGIKRLLACKKKRLFLSLLYSLK